MVLRALADAKEITLGDLLEGIVLHALDGKSPFSATTLKQVAALREVFGLDLTAEDSHRLTERVRAPGPRGGRRGREARRTPDGDVLDG